MSRLKIGVYGPDPATVPRTLGVLEARARRPIEVHDPRWAPQPDGVPGSEDVRTWLESLAEGRVDVALCPIEAVRDLLDERIAIVGVPERSDPRDVLLGRPHEALPLARMSPGSRIAAYQARTRGLLRAYRRDLDVVEGTDLTTDLASVDQGQLAGVVTSYNRIAGTSDVRRVGESFPLTAWIPAPGHGALAILTRRGEAAAWEVAEHLVHPDSMRAVQAELEAARALSLSKAAGLGVVARTFPGGMRLWGMVVGEDGRQVVRGEVSANGGPPEEPARELAALLEGRGAASVGAAET